MRRLVLLMSVTLAALSLPALAGARVLRVGTYHGIKGQYRSIAAAVKAAHAGDWILVGPGDYKTHSSRRPKSGHPADDFPAAILITQRGLHLRGMNRNKVIVDGTKSGPPCNRNKADQNFGPKTKNGPAGLNGIMVWKADNVWVQNLTSCNFLGGSGAAGNQIWWNGGADSGGATKVKIGGWGFLGTYLTTTSTFFKDEHTAAQYGIFSSNWSGGVWNHSYASNFNDSGYYIGACGQVCDQTVNHAWAEFNALGYSGSNSGGQLVVKNSEWDNNEDGFDTNSQEGDNPPPQNGACPHNGISPITHTHSCWVFMHNYVHDNNNPNVPGTGLAGGGPVGTGVSISGGRNDTVMHNRFVHNDAWGSILVPFPGSGTPCTGGVGAPPDYPACIWDSYGDAILNNTYAHNGGYGNPSNGDIGISTFFPDPTNCVAGNKDTSGPLTTAPTNAQQMYPKCNGQTAAPSILTPSGLVFTEEVACDATVPLPGVGKSPCLPTDHYPRRTKVIMHALPAASKLPTMPHPCQGVPANPWCRASNASRHKRRHHRHPVESHPANPKHKGRGFTG